MESNKGSIVYRYDPNPEIVYINATNQCTNRCDFCVRQFTPGLSGHILHLENEPTLDQLWRELQSEIKPTDREVAWCGFGEPTMRLDLILDITRKIKNEYPYIKVRLDTDGQAQLRNKSRDAARELKEAGFDIISISLNAENTEKYDRLCNPAYPNAYDAILKFTMDCRKLFSDVRLSMVGGTDADISKCREIADKIGCKFIIR